MSKALSTTDTKPHKKDLFDRIAEAFGFETTATGRKPRFRYEELTVVYDRLHDLGYIAVPREGEEVRATLRGELSDALGYDRRGGRPVTHEAMSELVEVLLNDDVVPDGGSAELLDRPEGGDSYPTDRDLERADEEGYVYEWTDVEECVCVSRHQNSTTYHPYWTIREGELTPACMGVSPSDSTEHRLVEEDSISRTKEECEYCKNDTLRL